MVVDCGGGTVDITVHQLEDLTKETLKELHKVKCSRIAMLQCGIVEKQFGEKKMPSRDETMRRLFLPIR